MTWYFPSLLLGVTMCRDGSCFRAQIEQCEQHGRSRAAVTARLHAFFKYDENQVMVRLQLQPETFLLFRSDVSLNLSSGLTTTLGPLTYGHRYLNPHKHYSKMVSLQKKAKPGL